VCSLSRTSLARPWVESGPQASAVADRQPDLVTWPKGQRRPNWPSMRCGRDASVTTCRSPVRGEAVDVQSDNKARPGRRLENQCDMGEAPGKVFGGVAHGSGWRH
jgi:hypothetical protein